MPCYIIDYDLRKQGQDYDSLIEAIKAYKTWAKIMKSSWAIVTADSAEAVRDNLRQHIDSNDRLFVARASGEGAWVNLGTEVSDWLLKNL